MKSQTIEDIKNRYSTRSFKEEQITDEELNEILTCGLKAPSAKNIQEIKITVVQDKETIKELSKLNAAPMNMTADPFYGAPTVCFIMAPKENDRFGWRDGAAVLTNMLNAAFALGIGSCWINRCYEMFELEQGKKYLSEWGLEDYRGVGCCILGYPAKLGEPKEIKDGRIVRIR